MPYSKITYITYILHFVTVSQQYLQCFQTALHQVIKKRNLTTNKIIQSPLVLSPGQANRQIVANGRKLNLGRELALGGQTD